MGRWKEGQTNHILYHPSCRDQRYNNLSSAIDWWENTKYCFNDNAKIFSKNFTTRDNITILRLKRDKKENLYKRENFKPQI